MSHQNFTQNSAINPKIEFRIYLGIKELKYLGKGSFTVKLEEVFLANDLGHNAYSHLKKQSRANKPQFSSLLWMDVNDLYQSEDKCCHWCNSSGENLKVGGRSHNDRNMISLNRFKKMVLINLNLNIPPLTQILFYREWKICFFLALDFCLIDRPPTFGTRQYTT